MGKEVLIVLVLAAFVAGLVDAIAGGGGIITLPALLMTGLDPSVAVATNKGQALFGASASLVSYARGGAVDRARVPWSLVGAVVGSLAGAKLVLLLDARLLRPVVVVLLLVACAVVVVRKPTATAPNAWASKFPRFSSVAVAGAIGVYDGFFGPATGTFLVIAYAFLFGDALVKASGNAKVANFASNLGAFLLFAAAGVIRWELALPMGVAQVLGATLGAKITLRRGDNLVRIAVVAISVMLAARLTWQMIHH